MFNWLIKAVNKPGYYLPNNWVEGKSNKELIEKLKYGYISMGSGNMIVLELLTRLIDEKEASQVLPL